MSVFTRKQTMLNELMLPQVSASVTQVVGLLVESSGFSVPVGSLCTIKTRSTGKIIEAEVVGFRSDTALLMPFDDMRGVSPGDTVTCISTVQMVSVGENLLGRVIDGRGMPLDEKGKLLSAEAVPLYAAPPPALKRARIKNAMSTGINAIDSMLTLGRGQRMGIFAGTGVGKSVSLGMIARNTEADVNIICLVGERGREVREFIERDLGEEGMKRSVVVVATSDTPALMRVRCAYTASSIAEYFRDKGLDVMLMMDSVTRVAMAQREIGLATGEPSATKGYTPSVFSILPQLLERSGVGEVGSITALYAVLVEADDLNDPISDAVRGILDGHIVLSRALANKGHYPAVDVLESISRVMVELVPEEYLEATRMISRLMATYAESEDLINIGAYVDGSSPDIDKAKRWIGEIRSFLQQGIYEKTTFEDSCIALTTLVQQINASAPAVNGQQGMRAG